MTDFGEMQVRRREPCEQCGWAEARRCNPRTFEGDTFCDGCTKDRDGSRWVVIGTLVAETNPIVGVDLLRQGPLYELKETT